MSATHYVHKTDACSECVEDMRRQLRRVAEELVAARALLSELGVAKHATSYEFKNSAAEYAWHDLAGNYMEARHIVDETNSLDSIDGIEVPS